MGHPVVKAPLYLVPLHVSGPVLLAAERRPGGNCVKIGLPGKLILGDYFQKNMTS